MAQPGIGAVRVRRLFARFGTLARAAKAPVDAITEAIGGDRGWVEALLQRLHGEECMREAMNEIAWMMAEGATHRVFGAEGYPILLAASADPPALLSVRGTLDASPEATVAIVGSRRATTYGRLAAGRIAAQLAERGVVIVSGGARGIDAEAHRGALRAGGRTIAVMATGLGHAYPPEHRGLYDEIVSAEGAVLTEQTHAIEARPELFPRRNRIVAGLSIVTVVIEAASRSGALLTARLAVEDDGRDVGCLPGPVDQPQSEGCHRAIREGWAHLVTGADDIIALLDAGRTLVAGAVERSERLRAGVGSRGTVDGDCCNPTVDGRGRPSGDECSCITTSESVSRGPCAPACLMHTGSPERGSSGDGRAHEVAEGRRDVRSRGLGAVARAPATSEFAARGPAIRVSSTGSVALRAAPPDEDEVRVLGILAREPLGMDELEAVLEWPVSRIAGVLLRAEMAGRVERSVAGAYACRRRGTRSEG
jgi:DNA processing protein